MRIECLKDKLQRAIFLTERIVGKNLSLPILANIFLEAKKNNLIIRSTNLDIGIEVKIAANIEKEGSLIVKPSILSSFLNNLKNEDKIKMELINDNLDIKTKNTSTIIKCESIDDFPIIPSIKNENLLIIKANEFIKGLKSVFFAASFSDIKPEIASVYIYKQNNKLFFVATDSFRLAEYKVNLNNDQISFNQIIIPFKNITEIIRVFEDSDYDLNIYTDENQLTIYTSDFYLTSRIIDGVYPDYRQIMPKQFKTQINIKKEDLIQTLKLNSIFLNKLNQIKINFDFKNKTLKFETKNQDIGENATVLPVEIEKGEEDIQMNFNAKYIIDSFNSINEEVITLNFNETNKPLLIQGLNNNKFSYIIMPLNN